MSFSLTVDRERCIGSGSCVMYAPGAFAQDEEAKAVVLDPIEDPIETVRVAVEGCPTHALTLTESTLTETGD